MPQRFKLEIFKIQNQTKNKKTLQTCAKIVKVHHTTEPRGQYAMAVTHVSLCVCLCM